MGKKKIKQFYRDISRISLNKKNRKRLKNSNFTIISSNCIGGVIYHELGLQFQSPTINMYFMASDFIKFCANLKFYLEQPLEDIGMDKDGTPMAKLYDITLYCIHYKDFDEIKEKWEKRCKRVNYNNIYLIMSERDGCTYEDILEFDRLPYKNKVIFVHKEMPKIKSAYYIKGTEIEEEKNHKIIGLTAYKGKFLNRGYRYIDDFDYVSFLNNK